MASVQEDIEVSEEEADVVAGTPQAGLGMVNGQEPMPVKSVGRCQSNLSFQSHRKAVRATLILLPLLGLHWLLTIYRPQPGQGSASCHISFIFSYLNVLLDGCQGTMDHI